MKDRAFLITGAGRGIGRAAALHLAARGAVVIVNDLDMVPAETVVAEIIAAGGRAHAAPGSIADWDSARRIIEQGAAHAGRLDGLVNNAGLHYQALPATEREAKIRATVEVNLLGAIFCGLHAAPHLARHGGAIVNITSAAHLGAEARAVYGATKGAIASLTYGWARDMAADGIRVNALAPLAATRMTDPSLEPGDPGGAGEAPYGDLPGPELIAPAIAFLLSPASAPITGRILRFDGRRLTLIEPPRISSGMVEREVWDEAGLLAASNRLLAGV